MWTDCFWGIGGFDESFPAGEDIDLSWRAQLAGLELAFGGEAVVERRDRTGALGVARQHYRYGRANALLYRRHRHSGMRRHAAAAVARDWRLVASGVLGRGTPREEVARLAGLRSGQVAGSLRNRVMFP